MRKKQSPSSPLVPIEQSFNSKRNKLPQFFKLAYALSSDFDILPQRQTKRFAMNHMLRRMRAVMMHVSFYGNLLTAMMRRLLNCPVIYLRQ
jgi:hypothetical protein